MNPLARAGGFKLVEKDQDRRTFGTRSQERVDLSTNEKFDDTEDPEPARKSGWI